MTYTIQTQNIHASSPSSSPSPAACSTSTGPDINLTLTRRRPRDQIFQEIDSSVPLKLWLHHLREEDESYRQFVNSHEELCRTRTTNCYHVLSFFAVFQGNLFATISQATVLTCADVWTPLSLSFTACVGAVLAVKQNLHYINVLKEEIRKNKDRVSAVSAKIEEIKLKGKDFDFSEPERDAYAVSNDGLLRNNSIYNNALPVVLAGFSLCIMACTVTTLCRECKCV